MAAADWITRRVSVASLHLDTKNPRLGRETLAQAPREIIQYLFEHDKAIEVAESIATRGFFPNEPLLAVSEENRLIVVEGNRRLAALKALREPGLLGGAKQRQVEKLSRKILDQQSIATVPVTIAPNRKATDRQIAGRHIGTPVLAWQAENRASFILEKLTEGYDNDELRDELGFSLADIQSARQTRAIADMARSLALPDEVKAKLDNPRAKIFTTLGRVFDSTAGRDHLYVEKDADHGLRGTTSKSEFVKAFTKLVSDVALGTQSSRTLNSSEDIQKYFKGWKPSEKPTKKNASFVPAEVIQGKSVASPAKVSSPLPTKKSKVLTTTVLPRDLKVRHGTDRLVDIRSELIKLKRKEFPNAGAVLLRVFFELTVTHYLERIGAMKPLIEKLGGKGKLPFSVPTMKQMVPTITKIAKDQLDASQANKVEKALKYDAAAPFSLSELHAFIHQAGDLPSDRDIWQFWLRTEPLFRLMLEDDDAEDLTP
jgi:ParB-like chromosome segregation protein Spo0J